MFVGNFKSSFSLNSEYKMHKYEKNKQFNYFDCCALQHCVLSKIEGVKVSEIRADILSGGLNIKR